MVINLKIVKIIKLQITCCLVFPFLAKNNLFNWSCGSEVVLTSVLTDYSEGIRPVSFIGAVLQFWREHCMQKNAKVTDPLVRNTVVIFCPMW